MSNINVLFVDNDNVLEIQGLKDEVGAAFLAAAAVSVTLSDEQGLAVQGADWPLSLAYVDGSRGEYRATLPYTLDLTANRRYTALIVADAGPGRHAEWSLGCVAKTRS